MRALSRTGVRFGLETLLIVLTALVTGVLHLGARTIIGAVVIVWIATSVFEFSRAHPRAAGRSVRRRSASAEDEVERDHAPGTPFEHVRVLPAATPPRPDLEAGSEGVVVLEPEAVSVPELEPVPEPEAEPVPAPEPEPETASAEAETVVAPAVEADVPEPEAVEEPAPVVEADPPAASDWPVRPAEPEPAAAAATSPAPAAEALPVTSAPWSWNVWNLERVVRERDSSNEELQFLLLYLRDYASPSGMLPPDFDGLVRESFGDLLAAPS